ncbi:MAG: DUF350 domain-containing protein [bacterium]|nr:DUF350 domain-containing protein [bacterium]
METGVLIDLAREFGYIAAALLFLLIGKYTLNLLTPFKVDDELSEKDNPAFGLSVAGYYLAIIIVFIGAIIGEGKSGQPIWKEFGMDFAWAAIGILLLNIARIVTDKIIFKSFSTRKEIIEDRNSGMGAVEFGVYISSGLVLAGAISGDGGGILTALAFFGLGQLGLIISAWIYQLLTRYNFHEEIEKDNVAAGVAFGGNCIAVGIILVRGTAGAFVSWEENLLRFGWYFLCAILLMLLGRFFIDWVLLPKRTLRQEIVEDRNINAGYLEGGVLIGLAMVISWVL